MFEDYRYFSIVMKNIEATIRVDPENKDIKVLNCSNFEPCYHLKKLTLGSCPGYCPIIVEIKKHIFRNRKPKASIHEIEDSSAFTEQVI